MDNKGGNSATNMNGCLEDGLNKLSLHCINCTSKILNPKVGVFTQNQKELPKMTQNKNNKSIETEETSDWFLVDDIFKFENVGFSKPVNNIKYLLCAECDLGPLGWSDTKLSYVALSRVKQGSDASVEVN